MSVPPVTSASSSLTAAQSQADAFRNADFLKIMLSEITSQDPLQPQDTSKIVENMQKLQDLANSQYTKFRDDVRWGQDLIGKQVNVQQQSISDSAAQAEINQGLAPDVGYGNVTGKVDAFRQVGQTVYVTVNGHDYPIDNVKQVVPLKNDPAQLADLAGHLLGTKVTFHRATASDTGSGTVTNLGYDTDGNVVLTVAGQQVPYSNVTQIGLPNS